MKKTPGVQKNFRNAQVDLVLLLVPFLEVSNWSWVVVAYWPGLWGGPPGFGIRNPVVAFCPDTNWAFLLSQRIASADIPVDNHCSIANAILHWGVPPRTAVWGVRGIVVGGMRRVCGPCEVGILSVL